MEVKINIVDVILRVRDVVGLIVRPLSSYGGGADSVVLEGQHPHTNIGSALASFKALVAIASHFIIADLDTDTGGSGKVHVSGNVLRSRSCGLS